MLENYNLACAIHRHFMATPEAPAVVCQGRSLTYSQLAERSARLAACLTHSLDWARRDGQPPRVGIFASRGVDACVALLGACWAGATYVPISLKQPEERILNLFAQCGLSALITDDQGAKLLSERVLAACPDVVIHAGQERLWPRDSVIKIIEMATLPPVTPEEPVNMAASDTAYIIFTSGTTGVPKGVMISTGSARHYVSMIAEWLELRASDRALETCELSFDFSIHNMFSTWEVGAALHILPATTVMNAVKFARNSELTIWNSVPSLAGMLRQIKALAPESLANLRVTVFGGEQLPASTVTAWQSAAPNSVIFNLYGPTEATVFCLAQTVANPLLLTPGRDVLAIGKPLPGNEARVVDESGQTIADGASGELVIAGEQLADGYLGAPELTASRFPTLDGKRWYRTGDLALRDATGSFHCLGRIDNQVKVLGYRVELEEIDAHLRIVSGADIVGSVAWPQAGGMASGIVSFVGASSIDAEQVIDALKNRLPPYMLPSRIITLEIMPLNSSGKVDRRALLKLLGTEAG
ncbi:MAG: amino acid adenylation domain-containing protein [Propionivibrio sp.]|uniref:Amino acid adenylation domain-containing protein n=1 Tax=Candidatus Propionivibrio dominans TaxID=2954373 RepID=A0A9D7IHX7_9RHOO|nr:amino acid adenylation domain-containing protein [Candidatus Propionivibrio dominans]